MTSIFTDDRGLKDDNALIAEVVRGDMDSLEKLIRRHQAWIYNIALRMVCNPDDAQDITQEILIKILTKLSTYDSKKAAFRTWLYHVVANHVLDMKKKKYEYAVTSFEDYYDVAHIPDESPESYPGYKILIEEQKIVCYIGSLLCFDRRQRLVFILGAIFNVTDIVGSEIVGVSKSNFRKILSRSNKQLYNFVNQNCGLLNENNPCHCETKLIGHIKKGWYHADKITFYSKETQKVKDVIQVDIDGFKRSKYSKYIQLFREHPFYQAKDLTVWIRKIIEDSEFKKIFHFD